MGNASSSPQVTVKHSKTELSIQPVERAGDVGSGNVKKTLMMLSQLENEISYLIQQSNIKIIPQGLNTVSIALADLTLRQGQVLKGSAAEIASPDDPDLASKLLYIRKHIHRDIFTTYTSNHLIAEDPQPLHEVYISHRDNSNTYQHVYFSRPPVPTKSDLNLALIPSHNQHQQDAVAQNPQPVQAQNNYAQPQEQNTNPSKSRYRHRPKKPSVSLSDNQLHQTIENVQPPQSQDPNYMPQNYSQVPPPEGNNSSLSKFSDHPGSQSLISVLSTFTTGSVHSEHSPPPVQITRLATLKDSSSTSLLPPVPEHLISYHSSSSFKSSPGGSSGSFQQERENEPKVSVEQLAPPGSYIYSPISTHTESFHADIISLASEKENVVDLSQFPYLRHYAASGFQDETPSDISSKSQSRSGSKREIQSDQNE